MRFCQEVDPARCPAVLSDTWKTLVRAAIAKASVASWQWMRFAAGMIAGRFFVDCPLPTLVSRRTQSATQTGAKRHELMFAREELLGYANKKQAAGGEQFV